MPVVLTGEALTLDDVVRVARGGDRVELTPEVAANVRRGREIVESAVADGAAVYGVNTGVGVRKRVAVVDDEQAEFNRRLILDHRVGTGPAAPDGVVRAMALRMVNGFARGTAGVRLERAGHVLGALDDRPLAPVRMVGSYDQA